MTHRVREERGKTYKRGKQSVEVLHGFNLEGAAG